MPLGIKVAARYSEINTVGLSVLFMFLADYVLEFAGF